MKKPRGVRYDNQLAKELGSFKEALEKIAKWSHDATQIWDTTIPQKIAEKALKGKK